MDLMIAVTGAVGAAVIAASMYLKSNETFDGKKFAQTVILGGIAGFALGASGFEITSGNVEMQMAAYASLGAVIGLVIENIAKYIYRNKIAPAVTA
jgi:hypothetical protein